ncbi:MAG: tetraacyldisaccharide 4'-kinase [Phycisphaerae bacterium]|nr:tetraacyldisaccharide 4'-kinase [Phycisphaerae bacterium]
MSLLRRLLWPLAALYRGVIGVRNLYYDHVSSAVCRAGIPVISVGNLTVGGTGKTPLVIELVRRLQTSGHRPAILTRGYKGEPNATTDEVTPPRSHVPTFPRYKGEPNATADEVLEFQDAVPDVPVVVNPDRVAGAAAARREHDADCLVLDDGFQHRRLARDLDIVLIDALQPWGGGGLLPVGRLREPLSSLRRADLFVITRSNQADPATVEMIAAELHRHGADKPIVLADVEADALVGRTGRRTPPGELVEHRVLAVSGIGNPRTFEKLVSSLAGACVPIVFADHYRYSASDVEAIQAAARRANADMVVTTRKDWVKLAPLWPDGAPELARLDVRLVLRGEVEDFDARLHQALESHR